MQQRNKGVKPRAKQVALMLLLLCDVEQLNEAATWQVFRCLTLQCKFGELDAL